MQDMDFLLTLFNLAVGVFFLFTGIRGKGGLLKNDYPEEVKEKLKKPLSIFSIIEGVLLVGISVVEMYAPESLQWIGYAMYGICLVLVIGIIIYIKAKFGKELK